MGDLRVPMFMIMLATLIRRQSWKSVSSSGLLPPSCSNLCSVLGSCWFACMNSNTSWRAGLRRRNLVDGFSYRRALPASPIDLECNQCSSLLQCLLPLGAPPCLLQLRSLALALLWIAWKSSISPCLDTGGISWGAINMFQREIAHTVFFNRIISCLLYNLSYPLFEIL